MGKKGSEFENSLIVYLFYLERGKTKRESRKVSLNGELREGKVSLKKGTAERPHRGGPFA